MHAHAPSTLMALLVGRNCACTCKLFYYSCNSAERYECSKTGAVAGKTGHAHMCVCRAHERAGLGFGSMLWAVTSRGMHSGKPEAPEDIQSMQAAVLMAMAMHMHWSETDAAGAPNQKGPPRICVNPIYGTIVVDVVACPGGPIKGRLGPLRYRISHVMYAASSRRRGLRFDAVIATVRCACGLNTVQYIDR